MIRKQKKVEVASKKEESLNVLPLDPDFDFDAAFEESSSTVADDNDKNSLHFDFSDASFDSDSEDSWLDWK